MEEECPICNDSFDDIIFITKCAHTFDLECIFQYAQFKNGNAIPCPLCRQNIDIKDIEDGYKKHSDKKQDDQIDHPIDIGEFIKFKGVRIFNNIHCILNVMDSEEWFDSINKYVKLQDKILKLDDKRVLFETSEVKYYFFGESQSKEFGKRSSRICLPLENDTINQFEELDKKIEKIIKQRPELKEYKYNGFITAKIESKIKAVNCNVSWANFYNNGMSISSEKIRVCGTGKFILRPAITVRLNNIYVQMCVIQGEIERDPIYDFHRTRLPNMFNIAFEE